ncbi:hypothetical protein [Iningainema tapete]|uniref:Uncharacterized protein n=1 Tax=Iningainema tapete BLCC-T55 TaxID=2748662 RepID=A0A8J6XFV2_9CYAN|nr:hypothetical protein [Iningainema tapete]MBD2773318.1 hypothetical protein [Iningainema tapete BLCC-T55]
MKKFLSIVVGTALVVLIIWLGFRAAKDSNYVLWFGIASAIVAPIPFALFGYAFSGSDREVIKRLSRVPQIEELISQAQSQEEKIRILEEQRTRLEELVHYEAERLALENRKSSLERDAVRILDELEAVDKELKRLGILINQSAVGEQLQKLQERIEARRSGNIIIRLGKKDLIIDTQMFTVIPVYGEGIYNMLKFVQKLQRISKGR